MDISKLCLNKMTEYNIVYDINYFFNILHRYFCARVNRTVMLGSY